MKKLYSQNFSFPSIKGTISEIQLNTFKTELLEKLAPYTINPVTAKSTKNFTISHCLQIYLCYAKSRFVGNVLYFPI